jgi:hypothetical protein
LSAGGREVQCGWLKDRFGLSWQIVPTAAGKLTADADPEQANFLMTTRRGLGWLMVGLVVLSTPSLARPSSRPP